MNQEVYKNQLNHPTNNGLTCFVHVPYNSDLRQQDQITVSTALGSEKHDMIDLSTGVLQAYGCVFPSEFPIAAFQKNLITWFSKEKRDLPWRNNVPPYQVWISEIMLQQTRVDQVIPYYERFLSITFPTVALLAPSEPR